MSSEIVPAAAVTALATADDSAFKELAAASQSFLPRVQLCGASSNAVKEEKVPPGHWALIAGDSVTPLGKEVDILVLGWQPKAMRVEAGSVIQSLSDHTSDEFKKIQADSNTQDSGAMWGFEFLIWLYNEQQFATLLMASKTARREAPAVKNQMGKGATLKVKLIKGKKYTWHGPVCTPQSTPPAVVPSIDDINAAAEKFKTQPTTNVEAVSDGDSSDRAR